MADNNPSDITALTVQLVSAFVANNTMASTDLAGLIQSTRAALTNELNPAPAQPEAPTYSPAVSVRKSLSSPDHILSLIDGKPYKTLKRHLASHGLTPEQYRERYNLPRSYPLVATSYSDARRAVASKIGLGRKPVATAAPAAEAKPAAAAPSTPTPATAKAPAKAAPKLAPAKKAVSSDAKAKPVKLAAPAPKAPATVKAAPVAGTKPAPAKGDARKRLTIASPKDEKSPAKAQAAAKPEVKAATPKAKPTAAPKAAKSAATAKKPVKAEAPAVNGDAKPKADATPANG